MSSTSSQRKRASSTRREGSKRAKSRTVSEDTTEPNNKAEAPETPSQVMSQAETATVETEDTYSYTDVDFAPRYLASSGSDDSTAVKTEEDGSTVYSLQEVGYVYYFYRANAGQGTALKDNVQSLYMLLCPLDKKRNHKLWRVPKNSLPAPKTTSRHYCLVDMISSDPSDIVKQFRMGAIPPDATTSENDPTDSSSPSPSPTAPSQLDRMIARGSYAIASKASRNTIFYYMIDSPETIGPLQETFNVGGNGCFLLQCQNPAGTVPNYPAELLEKFQNCRYSSVQDVSMMEQAGSQLIITPSGYESAGSDRESIRPYIEVEGGKTSIDTKESVSPIDTILKALRCCPRKHPYSTTIASDPSKLSS